VAQPEKKRRTLGAVLYEDFELLDLYGPLEMFGNLPQACRIVTVAETTGPVRSTPGPSTLAEFDFDDCPVLDLILLPGGLGTLPELDNPAMIDFLVARAPEAECMMSVCTGSALLARAGLLDGRRATSNKQLFELAERQSDRVEWVTEARWVVDWPFVTASGVSAGTDMSLAVIADLFGEEVAQRVADGTEYQWHRDPDTDPFSRFLNHQDVADYEKIVASR
jgi:transcriptional regulator GlxA family with amidase domain